MLFNVNNFKKKLIKFNVNKYTFIKINLIKVSNIKPKTNFKMGQKRTQCLLFVKYWRITTPL